MNHEQRMADWRAKLDELAEDGARDGDEVGSAVTYKEVTDAFIRWRRPDITDQAEVDRLSLAFFNASPTGELFHVHEAWDVMIAAGILPANEPEVKP